ncbi:MAG: ATP-binding protein [Pseudomonadales bacterium]|nr:ATP-binding protein [Pseudomonadales bacterium]
MSKGQRITVFIASMLLLLGVYVVFHSPTSRLEEHGVVIFSSLVMLSFITLLAEHFFTRPTDVVASTLSVLLLLSPIRALLSETGVWYWVLWSYSAALLVISLLSLFLLDANRSPTSWQNRTSHSLFKLATTAGSGRLIWFSVFFVTTLFYVDSQSPLFVALLAYSALLLVIEPSKALRLFALRSREKTNAVGELFSVQAGNSFLARTYPDAPVVNRFDVIGFSAKAVEGGEWKTGLVLDAYQLNQQRWLRILISARFQELHNKTTRPNSIDDAAVYLLNPTAEIGILRALVGIVCEGSDIQKLRFEYAFQVPIEEGELVEVYARGVPVLYQVVEGITGIEKLESRDEAGTIVGEAVQLGIWNTTTRSFDRFGWVPLINSPVMKASPIEVPEPLPNEYQIGVIPGTSFPVFANLTAAVTHHLAILGVTGSGKSVFARNLLRQIADEGTKIICVDFTSEYGLKLADLVSGTLIDGTSGEALFSAIDVIGDELDKFANQRNKKVIADGEKALSDGFKDAISSFVADDRKAVLFELPDVTNSTGILEYTKWFFKSLFQLAREGKFSGRNICVVLEEAHTVVPEWNFLGVDDKRSSTVVNSISQIALQGRKYGVGFMVIAQRTANVSKTVLTQCNSVIAFQQFDRTSADFLANHMSSDYLASLTRLKSRHAIAVGKAFSSGTPMIFEVPEISEHGEDGR